MERWKFPFAWLLYFLKLSLDSDLWPPYISSERSANLSAERFSFPSLCAGVDTLNFERGLIFIQISLAFQTSSIKVHRSLAQLWLWATAQGTEGLPWHCNVTCSGYSGTWGGSSVLCPPSAFLVPSRCCWRAGTAGGRAPGQVWVAWSLPLMEPPPWPTGPREQFLLSSFPLWMASSLPFCLLCIYTAQSTRVEQLFFLILGFPQPQSFILRGHILLHIFTYSFVHQTSAVCYVPGSILF